jgi:iron-sulfur cluster assembly protein
VDGAANLAPEYAVDELVLFDEAEPLELLGNHLRAEVISAAGEVLHGGASPRQGLLDALLELVGTGHTQNIAMASSNATFSEVMVTLTDIAADKVRGFLAQQENDGEIGLRVGVRGGGCSGFQYALALDERREEDHVFEHDGIRLIVDPASLRYVEGSQVDFTESLMGSGFEVKNPNVVASCGCGSSFRIADEEPSCGSPA